MLHFCAEHYEHAHVELLQFYEENDDITRVSIPLGYDGLVVTFGIYSHSSPMLCWCQNKDLTISLNVYDALTSKTAVIANRDCVILNFNNYTSAVYPSPPPIPNTSIIMYNMLT